MDRLQIYNAQYVSQEFQEERLLIVSYVLYTVCNDKDTLQYKGPTVMSMKERVEAIENCKWVQQVIPDAPWILDEAFLKRHNIDLVAHDDIPYAAPGQDDVYGWVSCSSYGISRISLKPLPPLQIKEKGKFLATQRTEGISTSDLILRIVQNHDLYCKRLIRRGYTREQLNLQTSEFDRLSSSL